MNDVQLPCAAVNGFTSTISFQSRDVSAEKNLRRLTSFYRFNFFGREKSQTARCCAGSARKSLKKPYHATVRGVRTSTNKSPFTFFCAANAARQRCRRRAYDSRGPKGLRPFFKDQTIFCRSSLSDEH